MNLDDLTEEQKEKARACKTTDELIELVRMEGIDLSEDELKALSGGDDDWYTWCTTQKGCGKN